MAYQTKINPRNSPEVNRANLSKLSTGEWAKWIEDRLHSRDEFLLDKREEFPCAVFHDILSQLEGEKRTRVKLFEGILRCLDRAYFTRKAGATVWADKALDNLLLLAGYPAAEYGLFAERADALTRFLDIFTPHAYPPPVRAELDVDLYGRTLSVIVGSGLKFEFEFWLGQLSKAPARYSGLCFTGAESNSPGDAIALLSHVDWIFERKVHPIYFSLKGFLARHGNDADIMRALLAQRETLPPIGQQPIDLALRNFTESQHSGSG